MKRAEYYVSVVLLCVVLVWTTYILNSITSMDVDKANVKISELDVRIKILESKAQRDTVIINLNLKKDGI